MTLSWFKVTRAFVFSACVAFFAWRVALSLGEWRKADVGTVVEMVAAGEVEDAVPSMAICRRRDVLVFHCAFS